jgi:hypothetical protein
MIRELYNIEIIQNPQKYYFIPRSTRYPNSRQLKNQNILKYKTVNTSSNKRPRTSNFSNNKNNNKSFSREIYQRVITESNQNFLKEFEDYKQNLKNNKSKNSSDIYVNLKTMRNKNNFIIKDKYNNTDIRPKKLEKELELLVKKKMLLLKKINELRKEKKILISLNQKNIEYKHKINLLEKEIDKYKNIIQGCQKNYIDLSYEYSNIKINLEKIIKFIHNK